MKRKFLSLLLALCLVVGMMPLAASAEESTPWMVVFDEENPTYYATFDEAFSAVQGNEDYPQTVYTIFLTKNAKESIAIENNEHAVVNIDSGVTLTNNDGEHTITVEQGGSLRITGSGTVDNVSHRKAALYNQGVCVVEEATLTRSKESVESTPQDGKQNSWYVVRNGDPSTAETAFLTFKSGKVNSRGNFSSLIDNYAKLTIEDGTFSNGMIVVKNEETGTVDISGGTFGATYYSDTATAVSAFCNYGQATISGGTFTSNGVAVYALEWDRDSKVEVTGGTFTGNTASFLLDRDSSSSNDATSGNDVIVTIDGKDTVVNGDIQVNDSEGTAISEGENGVKLTINGGKIAGNLITTAETAQIVVPENTAAKFEKTKASVAQVKETGACYASLQAAIDAAPAGATVTLLKGVELNGGAGEANGLITITKDIVLDGQNQFAIKAVDTVTEKTSLINIQNGADVTIKDLTLDGNGKKVRHGLNINDAGDVKVEKVTIKGCGWYAIVNNGTNLTIDGLTTDGTNGWGINVDENGTVTINNANIRETDSIVYENPTAGFLTVNDGSYGNVILQAAGTSDTVGGKVSLNKGTYNGVVTKGEGEDSIEASKVVSVAVGTKFTNYTEKPVDGEKDGNYIAIGDLLEEGLEVDGSGTVVEDKPYVPPVTPSTPTYANTVSDTENGKVTASPTRPKEGATVTITTTPDKGYEVGSVSVTDADGKAVAVTNAGNGKYTFKQPDSKVTIKVTFVWDNPFTDVGNAWYRNAIQYVYENNLMAGTGDTTFDPEVSLTRAMTAQILYNLEGKPKVDEEATFADMNEAPTWSVDAIAWAQDTGVVAGMGDNEFAPNAKVTREQFAQMMYNYAKYKKYDLTKTGDLSKFPDDGSVSDWAETAMSWANGNGLINGHEDSGLIDPAGNTIRGQAASILMNFDKNVVK